MSEAWLTPWRDFLTSKGVRFHDGYMITRMNCDVEQRKMIQVTVQQRGIDITQTVVADYFISALSLAHLTRLVNDQMRRVDGTLQFLDELMSHGSEREESQKIAEHQLIHRINAWHLRPEAYGQIQNFMLAADYVRTNTSLYTMEGGNEAARRAVNAILLHAHSKAPLCEIWDQHEPLLLAPLRYLDYRRYRRGQPWSEQVPLLDGFLHFFVHVSYRIFHYS